MGAPRRQGTASVVAAVACADTGTNGDLSRGNAMTPSFAEQLAFDLDAVASPEEPCHSPPRSAFATHAEWLAAGGGRPVTAPCPPQCGCTVRAA